ncbi:MAG: restriction endonuclease subunit S [Archaeoglobaceae archaeon]
MNKIEFYKETNFKQTEIGEIPIDWKITNLSDKEVAEIIMGQSPPSTTYNKNGRGLPFLQGKMEFGEIYPSPAIYCSNPLKVAEQNDVLISVRAPVGDVNIAPYKLCIGRGLAAIRFNPEKANFQFYFYYLKKIKSFLENLGKGSTFKAINRDDLERLKIPLPPFEEQRAVAWVLSVVDLAIQRTDMVIAKTERLKKGLMQTLLTKGIGHKEFKDTEIGKIPKTWQIVSLKDVVVEAKSGFACGQRDENGILQLRMDNIDPEGWINMEAGVKVPPPPDVEDYILKPGDILFNNTNSVDLIGKTAIFRGEFPRCVYSNHITRIRVNQKKIVPEWILYLLIRKWELGVFKAICHRHVHQAGINNEDLLRLKIPLPPIEEQQAIVSTILANDNVLKFQRNEKAKLERIKQGLMDLLLTGKVRVKVIK